LSDNDEKTKNFETHVVHTGGCHDCGGRCPYTLYVENGRVTRMEPDESLRACIRGYALRQRVYSKDRLQYPLKRVGARGEGNFTAISWDEALDTIAAKLKRVKETYGNQAIMMTYLSGNIGTIHSGVPRLLGMFGGCISCWGGPSAEAYVFASRATYGTLTTGNSRDDLANSRLIIMWGWNPIETIFSTGTSYQLTRAKEVGARIIGVDPRFTRSLAVFADQWIPIKPGTDTAMLISMAYVMIKENLHDAAFLEKHTIGFKKFESYVLGDDDSIPKTPEWAEAITGVPAETIRDLAREYAKTRPAALVTGFAPGRTIFGEQFHRSAATLACMTGNVGISGGSAAGFDRVLGIATHMGRTMSVYSHTPYEQGRDIDASVFKRTLDTARRNQTRVHWTKVWDAVLKGKAGGYPSDIKLLYVATMNPLNQCCDTNKGIEALHQLESVIVHEQFMTPTAKFADIILPVNTHWARNDLTRPWYSGAYHICINKAIDDLPGTKSDYEICCELAPRLGIIGYEEKSPEETQKDMVSTEPELVRDITDFSKFKKDGLWRIPLEKPAISLKKQIEDPENNPFPTPSGKIEIYSSSLAEFDQLDIPPIPKYIEYKPEEQDKYPLQLVNFHHRVRAHSCFDNVDWLKKVEPQTVWISCQDARSRGIENGDLVNVQNNQGILRITAKVTERIMPGVVGIGQGAWYRPDEQGIDEGGCGNVLIEGRHSPGGGFVSNSTFVEVSRA